MDLRRFLENEEGNKQELMREYEELIVRRDQLSKEAGSLLIAYTSEFGDLVTGNFELKIECIKIKKMINYCRRRQNRGLSVNIDNMNEAVEKEMQSYYIQLKEMAAEVIGAKKSKPVGDFRFNRAKKIYRRLTKLLHPDVNRMTAENEELSDLWDRIVKAYHSSDVDELDDLEVLVRKKLEDLGDEGFELDYDNLEERIERVERQITNIITTEPYIYSELFEDDEKKQAHKDMLQTEKEEYESYLADLNKNLEEILKNGGTTFIWKMS